MSVALFGRADDVQKRNLRHIIWSGAFIGFIDGGIWVYLPVYLARLGASPAIMGWLESGPALVNMLLYLPGGAFVERQKDLIKVVNWSVFLHRCGFLVIAALPFVLDDLTIPLVAAVIWSLINATTPFFWPALLVVIQRSVSPRLRSQATGGRWATMTIVAAILIPILGVAIDRLPFPSGYQLAFVISFVCSLPNIYFFSRIKPAMDEHQAAAGERQPLGRRVRDYFEPFLQSKAFVRYNVATALFRVCLSMPAGLYSLFWVNELQASDTLIGLRGMVGFGALGVSYWMWGRLAHRLGHRRVLMVTGAAIGIYPVITALSPSAEWLLPAAALWGVSVAGIDIGMVDLLISAGPRGRQPSAVAVGNLLANAERFVGPLIGAALAPLIGIRAALYLSGALVVASLVFFRLLPTREQEHADEPPLTAA